MKFSRRAYLKIIGSLIFWTGTAIAFASPKNVILFLVDDLGWADLGCYGSTFYDTPNIDALATQGVRFTNAYATCHVCSPSRASILTGRYPARIGLTDWIPGRREFDFQKLKNAPNLQALPLREITLAEALKRHGYTTGHFGKWHLGEDGAGPLQQGFDLQVPQNWFKGWPAAGYHAPFKLTGLSPESGAYLTDNLTTEALKFIEDNSKKPFFLYLSHFAVHDPIQGRADLVDKYEKRRKNLETSTDPFILEANPDRSPPLSQKNLERMQKTKPFSGFKVLPERTVKIKQRQDNARFAAMVEGVDESLGQIVSKLEKLELREDTIIILTSDNGGMSGANFGNPRRVVSKAKLDAAYSTSNLPLRGAKGWLYEGGIRVPLIIDWPGRGQNGTVADAPVIGTDLYPTILEMLDLPAMPKQHPDGKSLAKTLSKGGSPEARALYWHFPHYSNHGMQSPCGAIRLGRFKLIEYFENGTVQLFDLETDPREQVDLSRKQRGLAQQMLEKLRLWRASVNAMMPAPKPQRSGE
ncbi:MAG: sulfatase [Akkermansiaceae bacterium]